MITQSEQVRQPRPQSLFDVVSSLRATFPVAAEVPDPTGRRDMHARTKRELAKLAVPVLAVGLLAAGGPATAASSI
jgi:hypothetical protein